MKSYHTTLRKSFHFKIISKLWKGRICLTKSQASPKDDFFLLCSRILESANLSPWPTLEIFTASLLASSAVGISVERACRSQKAQAKAECEGPAGEGLVSLVSSCEWRKQTGGRRQNRDCRALAVRKGSPVSMQKWISQWPEGGTGWVTWEWKTVAEPVAQPRRVPGLHPHNGDKHSKIDQPRPV